MRYSTNMFDPNDCSKDQLAAIKWTLEQLQDSERVDYFADFVPVLDKWHADNVLAMIKVKD